MKIMTIAMYTAIMDIIIHVVREYYSYASLN